MSDGFTVNCDAFQCGVVGWHGAHLVTLAMRLEVLDAATVMQIPYLETAKLLAAKALGEYRVNCRFDDSSVTIVAFGKRNDGEIYKAVKNNRTSRTGTRRYFRRRRIGRLFKMHEGVVKPHELATAARAYQSLRLLRLTIDFGCRRYSPKKVPRLLQPPAFFRADPMLTRYGIIRGWTARNCAIETNPLVRVRRCIGQVIGWRCDQ